MRKFLCLLVLSLGSFVSSFAQPVLTRSGSYTYVTPPNQSIEMAKKTALERAKLQILEDEFGTVVGVSNISRTANVNGESSSSFLSVGETEVKGEWISTVGEPSYDLSFQDGSLVVKVTVTGQIREIKSSDVDIDVKILRNGIDRGDESEILKNDDDLFILFKSPVNGFVAVYQYDSDGVFRLLPYKDYGLGSVPVKAGKEYLFFEQNSHDGVCLRSDVRDPRDVRSDYRIYCNASEDLCRYYIIFSPNNFSIANDDSSIEDAPAQIDFESFLKWLGKARKRDKDMIEIKRDLTLKK